MSQPNFAVGGLKGLLKVIQDATPENQPSQAVLDSFMQLLGYEQGPTREEFEELRKEVQKLKMNQTTIPPKPNAGVVSLKSKLNQSNRRV